MMGESRRGEPMGESASVSSRSLPTKQGILLLGSMVASRPELSLFNVPTKQGILPGTLPFFDPPTKQGILPDEARDPPLF